MTFLKDGLTSAGHEVESATNGLDGLKATQDWLPDLLIVDRMIPKLNGIAVVKALRADGYESPVIFLTAMSSVRDKVDGLEAGGDDYLVKPFAMEELVARINALRRRPGLGQNDTVIIIGNLTVNRITREVVRAGETIILQSREYEILEFLASNAGQLVTRQMMLETIWDFQFDPGTNIVESHISRLRSKIDTPGSKPLIKTIRGAGYVLQNA